MELLQQKSHCNIWYLLQRQILLQKPITKEFIATAKTYYHEVYCNGLQRLTFIAIKVYYNKMKVIATKNFVAINLFSCSDIHKNNNSKDLDVPLVKIPVVNLGLLKSLSTKKDELLSGLTPTLYITTYIV